MQVCGGFVERRERELMRHHAVAQARDLREDEPNPVTAPATGAQLAEHCFIYRLLRIDKPLQLKAIVHRHLRSLAVKVASIGEPTDTVVMDTSTRRRFTITMKDSDEARGLTDAVTHTANGTRSEVHRSPSTPSATSRRRCGVRLRQF